MKYDVSNRYPSYLVVFLTIFFSIQSHAQYTLMDAITGFNKKSDTTIFYNADHIKNIASTTCCNQNFNEIIKYLSANNFVFIRYNQKQNVIVDKYKASLTFADLLGIAAFSSAPKSENNYEKHRYPETQQAVSHEVFKKGSKSQGLIDSAVRGQVCFFQVVAMNICQQCYTDECEKTKLLT